MNSPRHSRFLGAELRPPDARQGSRITLYFWVIKILCTTVGETFADNLNENLGLGLTNTSYIMGAVLIAVLVAQFRPVGTSPGSTGWRWCWSAWSAPWSATTWWKTWG